MRWARRRQSVVYSDLPPTAVELQLEYILSILRLCWDTQGVIIRMKDGGDDLCNVQYTEHTRCANVTSTNLAPADKAHKLATTEQSDVTSCARSTGFAATMAGPFSRLRLRWLEVDGASTCSGRRQLSNTFN